MKILKHGCCRKQKAVLVCRNCGLIAAYENNELSGTNVVCPECKEEDVIVHMTKDEIKDLLEESKEGM